MSDVSGKKRRMESDVSSMLDERKKQRTAEADAASGDAGQVTGEFSTELGSDTHSNDGSTPPLKTVNIEEENHMSVDVVVDDSTPVPSVSSDAVSMLVNPPSAAVRSISSSSVTDVIDVDAIDTEASCDEDDKAKYVNHRNPRELGLNEFYLQTASVDKPAEDVIDVDAEASEAAGDEIRSLDTAAILSDSPSAVVAESEADLELNENKSCDTGAVASISEVSDRSGEVAGSVITVQVQSVELVDTSSADASEMSAVRCKEADMSSDGPASDECSESQDTASSTDVRSLDTADIGVTIATVTKRVTESQKHSTDEDLTIDTHALAEIPAASENTEVKNATNSNTVSTQATTEEEMTAVCRTLPGDDVPRVEETVSETPVESESVEAIRCHGDEKLMDVAAVISQTDDKSSLPSNESLTNDTGDKRENDKIGCDNSNSAAEVKQVTDAVVSDTDKSAASGGEHVAEVMEKTDKLVSDMNKFASGDGVVEVIEATDKLVSDTGKVAADSGCVAEIMEMTDRSVLDTKEESKSLKPADTYVPVSENTKEDEDIIGTVDALTNTENAKQHSLTVQSVPTDTEEIEQKAAEVQQHSEVMDTDDDTLPSKDVVTVDDTGKMTAESVAVEAKLESREMTDMAVDDDADMSENDVSCSTELCQQPAKMAADTESGVDGSEITERTGTVVSEVMANIAPVDEQKQHVAVNEKDKPPRTDVTDEMCDVSLPESVTDLCPEESATTLKTVDTDVAVSVEATDHELNQPSAETIDIVKINAGDTETAHSSVNDADTKNTADAVVNSSSSSRVSMNLPTNSMEPCTDASSPVTSNVDYAKFGGGKSEEEEKAEMEIEPVSSSE